MHIVRIRHLFYPDIPRDYFHELSVRQVERGHAVDVLAWNKNEQFPDKLTDQGFEVHRLPGLNLSLGRTVQDYPYLPTLPSMIHELRPDVLHAESHLFLPTIQAIKCSRKMGLPSVVTVHGVSAERGVLTNFAQGVFLRALGRRIFQRADRIICLTKSDANESVKFGCLPEKIRLIPNAVDTELFKPCEEQTNGLVVWVGRFVPEKGVEYLIHAAKFVVEEAKQAKFLLIGYGPCKAKIMKLVQDYGLLGKSVSFKGPLTRGEISDLLGRASLFVFPSLKEGMPLSVLEAMACGVPVIGSDIPGIRDIVENGVNGFLVPRKNPKLLSNAILHLLSDEKLRRKFGERARLLVMERHRWCDTLSKLEEVYCDAIKSTD